MLKNIEALQNRLQKLTINPIAKAVGDTVLELVDESFKKDASPDGVSWPGRKNQGDVHPLLERTGALRSGFRVSTGNGEVSVVNDQDYAKYVQGSRPIVPNGTMPSEWISKIDKVVEEALSEQVGQ